MSYEIAGRMSWLVSWLDHWRGHAYADDTARNVSKPAQPRAWAHWLQNVSHSVSSGPASADDELISHSLAAKHLRETVEQLPSHERQVLLLHVNNGLTYWEIAARLGMDEEVVLRDLAHAYSQLRLELSSEELRR
jgi:DNA-directed RNA polymerase specialized sigma24 family protein